MIKHIEIKTYEYAHIKIMVRIDFDKGTISLIEKLPPQFNDKTTFHFKPKEYVFIERELEYMADWHNILNGMKHAITEATQELEEYLDHKQKEKAEEVTDVLIQASEIVRNRNIKPNEKARK